MSLYVIGDVQGCYDELCRLLEHIAYDTNKDELWFSGDLVNRGPKSLETLQFVKSLGERARWVLGNHELHLLSLAANISLDRHHTLDPILNAANSRALLDWVAAQPLLHVDEKRKLILVHAGLLPQWDIETARGLSKRVSEKLQGTERKPFLTDIFDKKITHPSLWQNDLSEMQKLDIAISAMTRIRFCYRDGTIERACKEAPGKQPAHLYPWYQLEHLRDPSYTVLFGHWAAHGYRRIANRYIALDSGCVWGGCLTAYRLDDGAEKVFQIDCAQRAAHPH